MFPLGTTNHPQTGGSEQQTLIIVCTLEGQEPRGSRAALPGSSGADAEDVGLGCLGLTAADAVAEGHPHGALEASLLSSRCLWDVHGVAAGCPQSERPGQSGGGGGAHCRALCGLTLGAAAISPVFYWSHTNPGTSPGM